VAAAMGLFDLCRTEVITGQFLDVSVQARGAADVDAAMTVLRFKSAKYSIERPLHIGAALAGADDAVLADLSAYGLPLGEAFQLRDDLLGVFGDTDATGKPAGDDLVEGKRTVLVALALDAASPEEARLLDRSLGTPLDGDLLARLRQVIDGSGAHRQVEEVIDVLVERSLAALDRAGLREEARTTLRELSAAATDRAV
jgi:geranylgeranyl diphosphate synthase, type I